MSCLSRVCSSPTLPVNDELWAKMGSDFEANVLTLEDDFLRDDGISLVTAEDYVHFRLLPLLQYYHGRAPQLSRRLNILQITTYAVTALISVAAILNAVDIVPLLVSIAAAVQAVIEFENYPVQLRNVNQALERLKSLRIWWFSLSLVERRYISNKEILVSGTEATVDSEISAWKKSMPPTGRCPAARKAIPQEDDIEKGHDEEV